MASLVIYGSSVASGVAPTTACQMSNTTGGTETSKTTTLTSNKVFGEITSKGLSVATLTAIPATPTGNGWVYSPGAGTFATGNWSASVTFSGLALSIDETIRFFRYSGGTYTQIGTITNTTQVQTRTTVAFAATSMSTITFAAGDLVYVDLWWHDNSSNAGGDNPTVFESNSGTAGVTSDMQVTTASFTASGGQSFAGTMAGVGAASAELRWFVGEADGVATASAALTPPPSGISGTAPGVGAAVANLTDWISGQGAGVGTASANLTVTSPGAVTQVATAATATALAYSPQRHIEALCDGSLLFAYQSAAATVSLVQLTNPSGTPTATAVTQTFTITGSTNNVGDIFILNNGTTTSDVWVFYADNGGTVGMFVAHGTYTAAGSGWSWDNTGTSISLGTFNSGFVLGSIVWTGTNLIVAARGQAGGYSTIVTYTTTKNGSAGWVAVASLDTGAGGTSHNYALLRHDAVNNCTLAVYAVDGDIVKARVVADSATPSVANWSSAATLSGTVNVGAANIAAALDTANKRLHVTYVDTGSSTNPQYNSATYTTTAITPGTAFAAGNGATTATGATVGLDAASPPNAYLFWDSAAVGAASDVMYRTLASPYGSGNLGTITNETNATAHDNAYPHVPVQTAFSGYVPLLYAYSVSPWNVEYDSTIAASSGGTLEAISGTMSGVATTSATLTTAAASFGGTALGVANGSAALLLSHSLVGEADGVALAGATLTTVPTGTGIATLAVTTKSQSWSGGPTGSPGTETDITSTDAAGNGWSVGIIPTYGGDLISSWYDVALTVAGANQTSLTTSVPDGKIHWLEQNGVGTFAGSEDKPFTLVEQAPTGTTFRRYYKGTFGPDANGFNWAVYACVYPGDPGLIAYRLDCINPSGSAITLSGSDGLEIALIGGMQQADATWAYTNGGYGTLAGGNTTPWPTASGTGNLVTADPDYVYITPANGGATTLGQFTVKQKATTAFSPAWSNAQLAVLVNSSREKIKLQGDISSFPASTTSTVYLLTGFKRSLTSTIAIAIAADYINPGTPTASVGSFTSFSYDERAYTFAAASNAVTATLDLSPAHVTVRYKPIYKITGWSTGAPTLSWGGTGLVAGTDYRYVVDAANTNLYIQLYADIVASGAGSGQRNNAALAITSVPWSGTAAGVGSATLTALTVAHALVGESDGVGTSSATLTHSVPLSVEADGVGSAALALTHSVPLGGTASGASVAGATLTDWISGSASGVALASAALTHSVPLTVESDGLSSATLVLSHAVALAGIASAIGGASATVTGGGIAGAAIGVAAATLALSLSHTFVVESDGSASATANLSLAHALIAEADGLAVASVNLSHSVPLIVESDAQAAASASVTIAHALTSEADGVATAFATIASGNGIVATALGLSGATATLSHAVGLVGASAGASAATLTLSTAPTLGGTALATSGATSGLTVVRGVGGITSGLASAQAILSLPHLLIPSANGVALATLNLTVTPSQTPIILPPTQTYFTNPLTGMTTLVVEASRTLLSGPPLGRTALS